MALNASGPIHDFGAPPLTGSMVVHSSLEPHWKKLSMGIIINVLTGILATQSRDRDAAILAKLRESYPAILTVIWRDFNELLTHDPQADILRGVVCRYIKEMAKTPATNGSSGLINRESYRD